ncbi:MAG: hypothetical protein ACOYL6_16905 [Bacteriovoracaceae bacterium]
MKKLLIGLLAFSSISAFSQSNNETEHELSEGESIRVTMSDCAKGFSRSLVGLQQTNSVLVKAVCLPKKCISRDVGFIKFPRYEIYLSTTGETLAQNVKKSEMDTTLSQLVKDKVCAEGSYYIWPKSEPIIIK